MNAQATTAYARTLVFAFLVVVAAFVVSTAAAERAAGDVGRQTRALFGNALPALHALAEARTDLRRVEVGVDHLVDARENGGAEPGDLDRWRARLIATTGRYVSLPSLEDER